MNYPLIDGHHKKLVSIINDFAELLISSPEKYKLNVGRILKSLLDYTIYHFSEEEKIMFKYKYKNFEEHKKIHSQFVKKLTDSLVPLLKGEESEGVDFHLFLCDWLLNHIAVTDKKWATYIRENYPDVKIE